MPENAEIRKCMHPGAFKVEITGAGTTRDLVFSLDEKFEDQAKANLSNSERVGNAEDNNISTKNLGMLGPPTNIVHSGLSPVPEEQLKLKAAIEHALIIIRNLYADKPGDFDIRFNRLYAIAVTGTACTTAHPEVAWADLKMLKADVEDRSLIEIQQNTLGSIMLFGVLFLLLGLAAFIALPRMPYFKEYLPLETLTLTSYFVLISSMFAGLWVSVAIWMQKLDFESLTMPLGCKTDTGIRILLLFILTIFLGLLIQTGLFDAKIGSLAASDFPKNLGISALLGFTCGMSHKALPNAITSKTAEIFGTLTKNTQSSNKG